MWSKSAIRGAGYPAQNSADCSCLFVPGEQYELLVRQAEAGNALAFEQLCWRYDEAILTLLLKLTASEQEALELCCATFLAAYQQWGRRKDDSVYIWMYRLAVAQWLKKASNEAPGGPLSPRERLVFTLKAGQHLALRTVAQILGECEATVARTFSRAVCKMKAAQTTL